MSVKFESNPQKLLQQSLFPAELRQRDRLAERRNAIQSSVTVCGKRFEIMPGVYQTSVDTELMANVVRVGPNESFLEVGCGCGAISILLAARSHHGTGVDINPHAIENSIWNQVVFGVKNISFELSDVFEGVSGKYDVLVCNPPYNCHDAKDPIERMFWDPKDEMKRRFFEGAKHFLKSDGRIFFGWADFADLDLKLPLNLADHAGFRYERHFVSPSTNGTQRFIVIQFDRK